MHSYENPEMSYECDLTAERDRLLAENAALRDALELIARGDVDRGQQMREIARAALQKAGGK